VSADFKRLAQVLAYTSDEASAMMLMNREKARKKILDHAASILQHWWLVHKKAPISARKEQKLKESKRSFVDLLQTVSSLDVSFDDCLIDQGLKEGSAISLFDLI